MTKDRLTVILKKPVASSHQRYKGKNRLRSKEGYLCICSGCVEKENSLFSFYGKDFRRNEIKQRVAKINFNLTDAICIHEKNDVFIEK